MSKDETPRTAAEIQADLAATRQQLASSVEGLMHDIQPKNIAKRAVDDAKTFVGAEYQNVKQQVKDEDGWRVDRLIAIGGAVLGAIAFVATIRGIVRASRRRAVAAADR